MGVYVPNMEKPKSCLTCFNVDCNHWGKSSYDNSDVCSIIEISDDEYKAFQVYIKDICKKIEERLGE